MKQSKLFSINSTSNMVLALITCLVHNPQFFVLTRMRAVTLPRDWHAIEPMIDVIVISQYKFAYSKTSSSYLCLPIPSPSVCAILSKYPPLPTWAPGCQSKLIVYLLYSFFTIWVSFFLSFTACEFGRVGEGLFCCHSGKYETSRSRCELAGGTK